MIEMLRHTMIFMKSSWKSGRTCNSNGSVPFYLVLRIDSEIAEPKDSYPQRLANAFGGPCVASIVLYFQSDACPAESSIARPILAVANTVSPLRCVVIGVEWASMNKGSCVLAIRS